MQKLNELSTTDRDSMLTAIRASLEVQFAKDSEATTASEGEFRRSWIIVSDE